MEQSVQTVVKDSHDAEASAVVGPTFPQCSTGGSPKEEPVFRCGGYVEADGKHLAREWLSTPVKVTFYKKGKDFENVPIPISFKQFYEDPELYGFTEDKKERVIRELKSRPGGNDIRMSSKQKKSSSTQLAHPFPNYVNDHHIKFTPGDKRFHRNVHSIGFKDRGATFTSFSTSRKTDKQPTSVV
ncbi:hypothetical protein PSTT_01856 [Puccinia striiformis]|uniref:Uncharacterized protein n=1 Tax=Puccinia striiformis TaxID=27350 RepID=A0A2S4W209_9BASI|nr:hypothetical protein PSTT_01856 [Puccinia striiformis]